MDDSSVMRVQNAIFATEGKSRFEKACALIAASDHLFIDFRYQPIAGARVSVLYAVSIDPTAHSWYSAAFLSEVPIR